MRQKYVHVSNRSRVFKAQFLHRTQVSKTRDASFLNGFKTLLTSNILSSHYASLQISRTKPPFKPFRDCFYFSFIDDILYD